MTEIYRHTVGASSDGSRMVYYTTDPTGDVPTGGYEIWGQLPYKAGSPEVDRLNSGVQALLPINGYIIIQVGRNPRYTQFSGPFETLEIAKVAFMILTSTGTTL